MKRYFTLLTILFGLLNQSIFAQGGASSCAEMSSNFSRYQACATNIEFNNSVGNFSGERYNTSCIGTNFTAPTWFFIKIKEAGNMVLQINQVDNRNNPSDVDFVLWGPFTDIDNICDRLGRNNEKDCSYSPDSQEIVNIPMSRAGDIYVLLIDNYSGEAGKITLTQIGGTGSTDCDFLSTVAISDEDGNEITTKNFCKPSTQTLMATVDTSDYDLDPANLRFNYRWYKNDILVNSTLDNTNTTNTIVASETGTYKVEITAYDFTNPPADFSSLRKSSSTIALTFVNQLSLATTHASISLCDYQRPYNDGITMINLIEIANQLSNITQSITYEFSHSNTFDTLINNPTQYINETANDFQIFIRGYVANQPIVCYSNTVAIQFHINVIPDNDIQLEYIALCNDSGFATFDLTIREPMMAAEPGFPIRYYENIDDASANSTNYIRNPKSFTNKIANNQTIYVVIPSSSYSNSLLNIPCNRILELQLIVGKYPENKLSNLPYKICIDSEGNVLQKALIDAKLPHGDFEFTWFKEFDAIDGNQISWGNTNIFETDELGNYSVRIMDITTSALCSTVVNFTVRNAYVPESIIVTPENLIGFETENTITITAFPPSQDYQYMINNVGWQNDNIFYNVAPGVYEVRVRNRFDCGETTSSFIVTDYPKFFSPNGDGFNDTWNVGGLELLESYSLQVFDRFGKLIKDLTNDPTGWDGTFKSQKLPADDYWFTIKYSSNGLSGEYKGHFSLLR